MPKFSEARIRTLERESLLRVEAEQATAAKATLTPTVADTSAPVPVPAPVKLTSQSNSTATRSGLHVGAMGCDVCWVFDFS